jgi:hypothetical protein
LENETMTKAQIKALVASITAQAISAINTVKSEPAAPRIKRDEARGQFFSHVGASQREGYDVPMRIKTPAGLFDAGDGRLFEFVVLNLPNGESVNLYPTAVNGNSGGQAASLRGRLSDPQIRAIGIRAGQTIVYTRVDDGVFDVSVQGKAQIAAPRVSTPTTARKATANKATNGKAAQIAELRAQLAQLEAFDEAEGVAQPARTARKVTPTARAAKVVPTVAQPAAGRAVKPGSPYIVPTANKARRAVKR